MNHGVQFSDEYIQSTLDEMSGAGLIPTSGERGPSISGDPRAVLDHITAHPTQYVLAVTPGIGQGHVVTPYAVVNCVPERTDCKRIKVYDNNFPNDATRYVDIDTTTNTYNFPNASGTWTGNGIYAMPLSIWRHSRSAPGLAVAGRFIALVVFGAADGLYTAPDGGQWGWLPDGSITDTLRGAKALTPFGAPGSSTRSVPLNLPMTAPPPAVKINVRGSHYYFNTAQGGRLMQLENLAAVAGDQDQVNLSYQDSRLSSFRFSPQRPAVNFIPRFGWFWATASALSSNGKVCSSTEARVSNSKLDPTQRGVELINDNTDKVTFELLAQTVDGPSGNATTYRFGPFEFARRDPAGCIQRLAGGNAAKILT